MVGARSAGMGAIDPHSDPGRPLDRQLGQNDPVGTIGPDKTHTNLIEALKTTYEYEYDRRRIHEAEWDRGWERMNNQWDFTGKRPWQSKRGLPAVTILALRLTWEITKQLETASGKWFEFETTNPSWQPLIQIPGNLVRWIMKSSDQPENNFYTNFYDAVLSGLICENAVMLVLPEKDGYAKIAPTLEEAFGTASPTTTESAREAVPDGGGFRIPKMGFGSPNSQLPKEEAPILPGTTPFRVRQEAVNPRFMLKDSAGRRKLRYVMWTQDMTPGEFRMEAEARQWKNVEEIIKDGIATQTAQNEKSREIRDKKLTTQKRLDFIRLTHFFGMLPDPTTGEVLLKNHYFIIANDKYDVIDPIENPFWHGQIPLISAGILRIPFSVYNSSFVGLSLDAQESRVELLNLLLDYLKQAIVPPYEVDLDQFASTRGNQLANGISPGMTLYLEKAGRTFPAVGRSQVPDVGTAVPTVISFLEQKYMEFTGSGDTGSAPRTRNRITAEEAKERMGASAGMMEQVYKNIEHSLLEPMLYQTFLVTLQDIPQNMWKDFIQEQIDTMKGTTPAADGTPEGEPPAEPPPIPGADPGLIQKLTDMQKWTARQRFEKLGAAFRPSVKVFSAQFSKRENLEKIDLFTGMCRAVPQLGTRAKWGVVGEDIVKNLDMDPARVLWPNTGTTAEQPMPMVASPAEQMQPPGGTPGPPGRVPPPPAPR